MKIAGVQKPKRHQRHRHLRAHYSPARHILRDQAASLAVSPVWSYVDFAEQRKEESCGFSVVIEH